jgi:outer membrane protein TolC
MIHSDFQKYTIILWVLFFTAWLPAGLVCQSRPALGGPHPALDLSLEECIQLALAQNRSLRLSQNSLAVREKSLKAAQTAFDVLYYPAVGAGAIDGETDLSAGITAKKRFALGPELSVSPRAGTFADDYSAEVGISLDIPLFRNFGKDINLDPVYSGQFAVRTADRSLYLAQNATILSVVSAVYQIMDQHKRVEINQAQVRRFEAYAALAEARERVHLASPIDVYRSLIRLRDAENRLSVSRQSLDQSYDNLKIILALPVEQKIQIHAPLALEPVNISLDKAVETAMENRIELVQSRETYQESLRRAGIAKQRILPDVRLRMGYSRYGRAMDSMGDLNLSDDTWRVMLTSSSDLMRTTEKINYQQSLYEVENARLNIQTTRDEIQKQVRRELTALEKALDRIRTSEKQIHEARGKRSLAEIKFNHGLADNFDVIEAETELQQAQISLVATRVDYIVGRYRLRSALGTLVETTRSPMP